MGETGTGKCRLSVDLETHFQGEIINSFRLHGRRFLSEDHILHRNFLKTQCVPIIVGGSNSYIEKVVEDPVFMFKYKYDNCFILTDVEQLVLNRRVDTRVDEMVNAVFLLNLLVFKYMFN
ncbi:hypothetical protein H5410_001658 [Solanum commersonii]|uniref:Uncharacterized protein n=1 Tax=Solanum commersonii TaxID=4109 RepID=A0A9J6AZE0_SOLCO|nr:hypothetical protein H5410_001658 [Solanum commersonii]